MIVSNWLKEISAGFILTYILLASSISNAQVSTYEINSADFTYTPVIGPNGAQYVSPLVYIQCDADSDTIDYSDEPCTFNGTSITSPVVPGDDLHTFITISPVNQNNTFRSISFNINAPAAALNDPADTVDVIYYIFYPDGSVPITTIANVTSANQFLNLALPSIKPGAGIAVEVLDHSDGGDANIPFTMSNIILTFGPASTTTPTPTPSPTPTPIPLPSPPGAPVSTPPPVDTHPGQCNATAVAGESIVNAGDQSVSETMPIVGAPFNLVYSSDNVRGRVQDFTTVIPLTGSNVAGLNQINLQIQIAGQTFNQTFINPQPNFSYPFTWNGLNASGEPVESSQVATVSYTYIGAGNTTSSTSYTVTLGHWEASDVGLGGWTPSIVHYYDTTGQRLYYGSGGSRQIQAESYTDGSYELYSLTSEDGSEDYTFGPYGQLLETVNGLTGDTIYQFGYDLNSGALTSVTDAFGNVTTFQYDSYGHPLSITSPYGQKTILTTDSNGWLNSATNPNNETYQMVSSSLGLLSTFTKPNGHVSSMSYNSAGLLNRDAGSGGDYLALVASITGSQSNVQTTTAIGRMTSFAVISNGPGQSSTSITDPSGLTSTSNDNTYGTSTSQDPTGVLTSSTNVPDARVGEFAPFTSAYSTAISGTSYENFTTSSQNVTLAAPGQIYEIQSLTTTTLLQGDPTRSFVSQYSSTNRTTNTISAVGRTSSTVLNSKSQISTETVGTQTPISLSYDTHGRLTSVAQTPRKTSLAYDAFGNTASITDSLGRKTGFSYDGAGRVTVVTRPDSQKIQYKYDKAGNVTSVTPPGKTAHDFFLNSFELISEYLPPSLGGTIPVATQYSYNLDKQLTQITRPDGRSVNLGYDPVKGSLLSEVSSDANDVNTTYAYSPSTGLLTQVSSIDGINTSYSYTGPLVTSIATSGAVTNQIDFAYATDMKLASIDLNGSGLQAQVSYGYDKDNLVTQIGSETLTRDVKNGYVTASSLGLLSETLSYNTFAEPLNDTYTVKKSTVFEEKMTRDNLGRITSKTENLGQGLQLGHSYTYDNVGRLTLVKIDGWPDASYTYDANGNRTSARNLFFPQTATYDSQDRLVQYGAYTYSYNDNGDLISKQIPPATKKDQPKDQTLYSWDALGRLKSVTLPDKRVIEYLVDGQGRRVGKKINGKLEKTWIYQSQLQIAAETNGEGKITKRFVYGEKANVPDYVIDKTGTYRIVSDHLGSPRALVNASTGKVTARFYYDEFGNKLIDCDENKLPFGFAGGLQDRETGLILFGARDYDPETGRFLSRDPLLFGGGQTNLYGYAMNDPINFVDPTGKNLCTANLIVAYYAQVASLISQLGAAEAALSTYGPKTQAGQCSASTASAIQALKNQVSSLQQQLNSLNSFSGYTNFLYNGIQQCMSPTPPGPSA
jgi:RHS repeat-associated protein